MKLNFRKFSKPRDDADETVVSARGNDGLNHPFLGSAVQYLDRSADERKRANNYRLAFFGALAIGIVLAVGLAYSQSQSRLIPFVVQVDSLGQTVAYKRADQMSAPTDVFYRAEIASDIRDFRGVSSDAEYEANTVIPRLYAQLTGGAKTFADEWFRANNPIVVGRDRTVRVHIDSIVRASSSSFQVDWTEETHSPHGDLLGEKVHMRGLLTYAVLPVKPNTAEGEDALLINPLGFYLTEISWDRLR